MIVWFIASARARRDKLIGNQIKAMIESRTELFVTKSFFYEAALKFCKDHNGNGDTESCSCHYYYQHNEWFIVFVNLRKSVSISVKDSNAVLDQIRKDMESLNY